MSALDFDSEALERAVEPLVRYLNAKDLHVLSSKFAETYQHLARNSTEHFLATPVTTLPTGLESGTYLAIDVGGTNLRVGLIELLGDIPLQQIADAEDVSTAKIRKTHDKTWPIEDHLKMDQADDLFAWIGDCIAEVLTEAITESGRDNLLGEELPLGITFSFPLAQTTLTDGILMGMGKGFAIEAGLSLGDLLLKGFARHSASTNGFNPGSNSQHTKRLPKLRIAAITNDTVATFAALAYATKTTTNSKTTMGLIVGTGCNATIPMKLKELHASKRESVQLPKNADREESKIVVNTEWTIRGVDEPMKAVGLVTSWDDKVSNNSELPGFQPFEYMTSGRYMGELVRVALIDTITTRSQTTKLPPSILEKNAITTQLLATSVTDSSPETLVQILKDKFPTKDSNFNWTPSLASLLTRFAAAVQARASALIAAATIGLLSCNHELLLNDFDPERFEREGNPKVGQPRCDMVVAYTGKTIAGYPKYLSMCQDWLDRLVRNGAAKNAGKRVVLKGAMDGGIIGAAVLAGMVSEGRRIED